MAPSLGENTVLFLPPAHLFSVRERARYRGFRADSGKIFGKSWRLNRPFNAQILRLGILGDGLGILIPTALRPCLFLGQKENRRLFLPEATEDQIDPAATLPKATKEQLLISCIPVGVK